MSKTLVIELPDELQEQLVKKANQHNISLENFILQSLSKVVTSPNKNESDPILPLLGTLTAEVNDIAENHDYYLGQGIQQEIRIAE